MDLFDAHSAGKRAPVYPSQFWWLATGENPAALGLREQVEYWFQELTVEAQTSLWTRLRSTDDGQHVPAFFELYVHHYMRDHFRNVVYERAFGTGKPDFAFVLPTDREAILEVVTLLDHEERLRSMRTLNRISQRLDKEFGRGGYDLELEGDVPSRLDVDNIVLAVREARKTELQRANGGFAMELYEHGFPGLIRVPRGARPDIKWHLRGEGMRGYSEKIRSVLQRKRKRYKEIKLVPFPFVVCLCTRNTLVNEFDVKQALYGAQFIRMQMTALRDIKTSGPFAKGGLLASELPDGSFQNTGISAVLFCQMRREVDAIHFSKTLYHNPFAKAKLPLGHFPECSEFGEISRSDEAVEIGCLSGEGSVRGFI